MAPEISDRRYAMQHDHDIQQQAEGGAAEFAERTAEPAACTCGWTAGHDRRCPAYAAYVREMDAATVTDGVPEQDEEGRPRIVAGRTVMVGRVPPRSELRRAAERASGVMSCQVPADVAAQSEAAARRARVRAEGVAGQLDAALQAAEAVQDEISRLASLEPDAAGAARYAVAITLSTEAVRRCRLARLRLAVDRLAAGAAGGARAGEPR